MAKYNEEQHRKMTETPMTPLIASLALPTCLSQLITTIYNAADTYFVAQIGTSAAAAVGIVFALMSLIQAVGFGTAMGAGSLISRKLGAKEDEEAYRYGSSGFAAALLFGTLLMIVGLLNLTPLMRLLGSTDTILPYSRAYARYILIGAPIMCSAFVLNNILRYQGKALLAMYGLCTGGILNMILDPIFIFVLDLGISGAALATVLSQCVSFTILLTMVLSPRSIVRLHPKYVSRNISDYALIYRTGLPTICRQGLGSLSATLLNITAAPFGDAAIASITIANKLYMLVRNLVLGVGQAFSPVAGYNYGAKKYARVKEGFWVATIMGSVICIAAAILLGFNSTFVIRLFRADDPEVIAIGTKALRYCCAVMPMMAYSTYVNQVYQGLGLNLPATILASCRQGICFVPVIIILPLIFGELGVAMAQPMADLLTFSVAIPFQVHLFRHRLSTPDGQEVMV